MNRATRLALVIALGALAAMLAPAVLALPVFGHYAGPYGDAIVQRVQGERHLPQAVTAVVFDYRGFDTMGEEFMLLAAVTGVTLLLRTERGEKQTLPREQSRDHQPPPRDLLLPFLGGVLAAVTVVTGFYVILHGHLSPGGGFQGGVVVATGFLYLYLLRNFEAFDTTTPETLTEVLEGAGGATYVIVGLAGLFVGTAFLQNILPLGRQGQLLSAGTIPLLNLAVGLEVAASFLLLLTEWLNQTLKVHGDRK